MRKRKSQIKALLVDVGGVLAINKEAIKGLNRGHANIGVHQDIARKLKISLDQWFDSIDTIYAESIVGEKTKEKVLQIISKNTKTPEKKLKKIIINIYKRYFKQNKQLFKHLFKLKKQGYKIGILSDQWHFSKEALMPEKLYKNFDTVVVSCDVGLRKPDPKIYLLALKTLKVQAKQVLFIDNQEWNMVPAKKLGMKTILFEDNKQLFVDLDKKRI